MNAWVRKEIKDSIRWLPIGMGLLVALLLYQISATAGSPLAWRSESLFTLVWFLSAAFATFLGLANYLPETWGAARGFLVQRGLSLHRIFVIRAVVNLAVYLIAMLVPLGALAVYFSVIGPSSAPVNPILVVPAVVVVLFSFSFYFGAVAVACRPCRWYGSRLFPLWASYTISLAAISILSLHGEPIGCAIAFPLGILGMLLLAAASRLTFLRGPSQPAPSRTRNISLYEKCMLLTAVLVATVLLTAFSASIFSSPYSFVHHSVQFTDNGMPWLVETRYVAKNGFGQQLNEVKFPITKSDEEIDSKPDLKELLPGLRFDYPWFYSDNYWDMLYVNSYTSVDGNPRNVMGYQGLLYVYQQDALRQTRLIAVVGKDLVDDTETSQIPFDQLPRLLWNESIFPLAVNSTAVMGGDSNPSTRNNPSRIDSFAIAATDGIYQVDFESGKVERILDMNLRAYSSSIQADENSGTKHLAIWDGSSVTMFQTVGQALNGPFKVGERIATLAIPNDFARKLQSGDVCFDYRDPDNWTIAIGYSTRPGINQQYEVVRSNQKEIQNYTVGIPQSLSVSSVDGARREGLLVSSMAPPVVLATFGTIAYILGNPMHDGFGYIGFIAAQAILSEILAILAARWRGLSAWQVASWCAGGLLIGLGTWFLVLSIYPRVFSTKCPACNRNRRIEREKCESCGAEWEPIAPLGIELFEGSNLGADAIGQTAPATLAVDRHQA